MENLGLRMQIMQPSHHRRTDRCELALGKRLASESEEIRNGAAITELHAYPERSSFGEAAKVGDNPFGRTPAEHPNLRLQVATQRCTALALVKRHRLDCSELAPVAAFVHGAVGATANGLYEGELGRHVIKPLDAESQLRCRGTGVLGHVTKEARNTDALKKS